MKTPTRKRQLTAEETAECAALKAIYAEKKKALKLTQDELGDRLGGIGQSGVSHYLNGVNALNIEAASGFARELQVPVSAFSPRLAAEIARIAQAAPGVPASAGQSAVSEPAQRAAALAALATPRSQEALERIAKAANEGRLTEADLILLEQIASRLESSGTKHQMPALGAPRAGGDEPNGNRRLREQLRNNDPGPRQ